jgi:hypothetical protein
MKEISIKISPADLNTKSYTFSSFSFLLHKVPLEIIFVL